MVTLEIQILMRSVLESSSSKYRRRRALLFRLTALILVLKIANAVPKWKGSVSGLRGTWEPVSLGDYICCQLLLTHQTANQESTSTRLEIIERYINNNAPSTYHFDWG